MVSQQVLDQEMAKYLKIIIDEKFVKVCLQ